MSKTYLNGPINVARLEGHIGSTPKVIYLFMDRHDPITIQTQCTQLSSIDINKYLFNTFKELRDSDKTYDFFMEVHPFEIASSYSKRSYEKRDIYIEEVVKLFIKLFRFDNDANKIKINEMFTNIRLHYLDIRYYLRMVDRDEANLYSIASSINRNNISPNHVKRMTAIWKRIRSKIRLVIDLFDSSEDVGKQIVVKKRSREYPDIKTAIYLARKMKDQYTHQDVKKILNENLRSILLDGEEIVRSIDSMLVRYESGCSSAEAFVQHAVHHAALRQTACIDGREVLDDLDDIGALMVDFYARLTDIFMLRRFLDKDYITNAIVYSGSSHSEHYIDILVNRFGFKITHVANADQSLDEIENEVREGFAMDLFERRGQCSDLTHFPIHFL